MTRVLPLHLPLQHSPPVQQPPMEAINNANDHPNQTGQCIGQFDQFKVANKGGHHPEGSSVEDQRHNAVVVQFHLVPAVIQLQQFVKFSIHASIQQVSQSQQRCVKSDK